MMPTAIASAASCSVAPARTAPLACEAMHPSQPCTTPIVIAISSLTLRLNAPSDRAAALMALKPWYTSGIACRSARCSGRSSSRTS